MSLTFRDLVAPVTDLGTGDPLQSWRWLCGPEARPMLVTAMGDLFIESPGRTEVSFLDTYEGSCRAVAPDRAAWKAKLGEEEQVHAWFMPGLVLALRKRGLLLAEGQCYSPIHPPILGGPMDAGNFEGTDWRVHMAILGQIHEQVKDLPPGTKIGGVTSD